MSTAEEVAVEAVAEVIEIKRNYGKIAAIFAGGVAIGSVATYLITRKRLEDGIDKRVDREVEESMKHLVKQMGLDKIIISDEEIPDEMPGIEGEGDFDDDPDPEPEVEVEIVTERPVIEEEPLAEVGGTRVFPEQATSLEDLAKRNQKTNYATPVPSELASDQVEEIVEPEEDYEDPDISVISRDIFMENGSEYEQITLTYFADDGVLDIHGDFVEDPALQIGGRRPPFGQMSDDANVVYVRNKRIKREFEIIFDPGNASDFITHTEGGDELKHSLDALAEKYRPDRRR